MQINHFYLCSMAQKLFLRCWLGSSVSWFDWSINILHHSIRELGLNLNLKRKKSSKFDHSVTERWNWKMGMIWNWHLTTTFSPKVVKSSLFLYCVYKSHSEIILTRLQIHSDSIRISMVLTSQSSLLFILFPLLFQVHVYTLYRL